MAVRSEGPHAIVRAKLAQIIHESRLPVVVFSQWVLGRSDRTAQRYLAGGPIPDDAANWIQRIEAVQLVGDELTIRLRWRRENPRWNRGRAMERRRRYYAGLPMR